MFNFSHALFICPLLFLLMFGIHFPIVMFLLEAACGLNTRTSRNVLSHLPPQNPFMAISNLPPLVEMAVLPDSSSDDTSCKFGSTQASLHTSVNSVAVMSRISLCLIEGNPPHGQDSTCSTVKLAPHTQFVGILEGVQPYLNARASTKAPL